MRRFFSCQTLAHLQPLESRWLLAASVSLDTDGGLLHVIGDESNDQIEVSLQFGVDGPGPAVGMLVTVRDHGTEIYSQHFLEGQLAEVRVSGERGDDFIALSNHDSPVNTFVSADHGNDIVQAYVAERGTPSRIHAGEGNDLVTLLAGREALEGYVVLGEGGNDTIHGSQFGDTLFGDNESASPVSIPGDDVIRAGGGDDALHGGAGTDELYGEDGNDFLHGGEGSDIIDGGNGNDRADIDDADKVFNIESVT
jgi:Ca2+-binding RTX toxin-like protein